MDNSKAFYEYNVEAVIHLVAESHAYLSIHEHTNIVETNIKGIFNHLETAS